MIEFEKEDLIVPTFLLTVFTLVLVLGTPSVDSRTVEEVVTFEVNKDHLSVFEGDELQYQEYRRDEIVCTSEVKIWEDVTVGAGSVVINNLDADAVYAGVPAEKVRDV